MLVLQSLQILPSQTRHCKDGLVASIFINFPCCRSAYEALEKPTLGNIAEATFKLVLLASKVNPVVNLVIAVADLQDSQIGFLVNWINNEIYTIHSILILFLLL